MLISSISYCVLTLIDPFDSTVASSRQRTYRFHGGPYTWKGIFDSLEKIRGRKYDVTYVPVEQAIDKEKKAKELGDVDLELEASHQLIQGRDGTLLPPPADNDRFPEVHPRGLEEVLRDALEDPTMRGFLGL
jgi:hypothetical protein